MELKLYNNITVGLVITGSFCTFKKIIAVIQSLKDRGMNVVPVFSENVQSIDNRFMALVLSMPMAIIVKEMTRQMMR